MVRVYYGDCLVLMCFRNVKVNGGEVQWPLALRGCSFFSQEPCVCHEVTLKGSTGPGHNNDVNNYIIMLTIQSLPVTIDFVTTTTPPKVSFRLSRRDLSLIFEAPLEKAALLLTNIVVPLLDAVFSSYTRPGHSCSKFCQEVVNNVRNT